MASVNCLTTNLDELEHDDCCLHPVVQNTKDAYNQQADRADKLLKEKQEREWKRLQEKLKRQ